MNENEYHKIIFSENIECIDPHDSSNDTITPGTYFPKNKNKRSRRKISTRSNNERVTSKAGEFNIEFHRSHHNFGSLSKWFQTLVNTRWRWTLLCFFLAFTAEWLFFGLIYWIIALDHGDLMPENLPPNQNITKWTPCVEYIYGFTSTFLFSIEVHTTVAYGRRSITMECAQAIFAMCMQCIVSSIFQSFMVGILFAKLTRPKGRAQTILFSKSAVINLRDGRLCLIFRVGDMRKSRILDIKANMFMLMFDDGLQYSGQMNLKTEISGCESTFFLWPISVIHVIDKESPLYKFSAAELLCKRLEILVVFEGIIESTGQPVQARSSFTESEIFWGHRFVRMVNYDSEKRWYEVNFSKLSETVRIDTPLCSSSELVSVLAAIESDSINSSFWGQNSS